MNHFIYGDMMEKVTTFAVDTMPLLTIQLVAFILGVTVFIAAMFATLSFKRVGVWLGFLGITCFAVALFLIIPVTNQVSDAGVQAAENSGVTNVKLVRERSGPEYLIGTLDGKDFLGTIESKGNSQYELVEWNSMKKLVESKTGD